MIGLSMLSGLVVGPRVNNVTAQLIKPLYVWTFRLPEKHRL